MDEVREMFSNEKVVVPPELKAKMEQANGAIEQGVLEPGADVAQTTEQMSMFAELGKLWKDTTVKRLGIMFKDVKAVFGVLPFINKISEIQSAKVAALPAKKMAAGLPISQHEQVAADIEAAVIAKKNASALHAVETAAKAQKPVMQADRAMLRAEDDYHRARVNLAKAQEKGKDVYKAQVKLNEKYAAYTSSVKNFRAVSEAYQPLEHEAITRLDPIHVPGKGEPQESWLSKGLRKVTHTKNDIDVKEKFDKNKAAYRAATGRELSDTVALHMAANGEAPAFTKGEKFKRGAKGVGLHLLLTNLGPIINPVPDVPELVTLGSYGVEAFGGQWWAGLIPPVWQYVHNRYEDVKLSYESSKKSMEIVRRHWDKKFNKLKEPNVAKAAEMFMPSPAKAAV